MTPININNYPTRVYQGEVRLTFEGMRMLKQHTSLEDMTGPVHHTSAPDGDYPMGVWEEPMWEWWSVDAWHKAVDVEPFMFNSDFRIFEEFKEYWAERLVETRQTLTLKSELTPAQYAGLPDKAKEGYEEYPDFAGGTGEYHPRITPPETANTGGVEAPNTFRLQVVKIIESNINKHTCDAPNAARKIKQLHNTELAARDARIKELEAQVQRRVDFEFQVAKQAKTFLKEKPYTTATKYKEQIEFMIQTLIV